MKHKRTKIYTFQKFQFHLYYWVISKNVLIKTQKPQQYYCPDNLLVKLSAFQGERLGLNLACDNFSNLFSLQTDAQDIYLHVFELYRWFMWSNIGAMEK